MGDGAGCRSAVAQRGRALIGGGDESGGVDGVWTVFQSIGGLLAAFHN